VLVCIDPGHGGTDPGAVAGGVREADIALDYALAVGTQLERAGLAVLYTRTTHRTIDLAARTRAANEAGASVFVSLHCNASASPAAEGVQIFHCRGSARGEALARRVFDRIATVVPPERSSGVFPDESPACGNRRLYVLRATRMPAILIELGFLTNLTDRTRLLDPEARDWLAAAIAAELEKAPQP
jgi:N-acetylmuramoyl-L-alanine amidase